MAYAICKTTKGALGAAERAPPDSVPTKAEHQQWPSESAYLTDRILQP
jgi:hypothetical protein